MRLNETKRGFTPTPKCFGVNSQSERGFALLLGSITGSMLLIVGLAIFNISIKEVLLSSAARESQLAFYAADTGIECALNWDFNYDDGVSLTGTVFATSTDMHSIPTSANCVGQDLTLIWDSIEESALEATTTFKLIVGTGCVNVQVTKFASVPASGPPLPPRTRIESRGHSTCDPDNPRRVQRAIFVEY